MKYILGIDNGGTVIKAALFDLSGKQIAVASQRIKLLTPSAYWTERKIEDLISANFKVIKECIQKSKIDNKNIVALGIAGHGKGLYITDKEGNPLYNGILSTDSRAQSYVNEWNKNGVSNLVFEKTYQKILACQPVALLRWFKDNKRSIYDKIGWVLSVKDLIRYKLTGKIFTEITDVSGTNLLNLNSKQYDKSLLELFDIEEMYDKLPAIKESAIICGYITKEAAKSTGLAEGTIVSGGMFDIDACAIGMGINNESNICVIGGTWSINEYISKQPVTSKEISMNSLYCIPDYYLIEESSPTSASNLEWMLNMFFKDDLDKFGGLNKKLFDQINSLAESVPVSVNDLIFYPFLYASNEAEGQKAGLINMTASTSKAEIIRAIYECIVFSHKSHIDKLLKTRALPNSIRLAGGIANSDVWSQMFADILGICVETISDKEFGCHGAALSAAIAAGLYADFNEAISKAIKINKVFKPSNENHGIYNERYKIYRKYIDLWR